MNQKNNALKSLFILSILSSACIYTAETITEETISDVQSKNLKETAQESADQIFGGLTDMTDITIRYTTLMQILRELNEKAQSSDQKQLVRNAQRNVEEQYRAVLTKGAQPLTRATGNIVSELNDEERSSINRLITNDWKTILQERKSESDAAARKDSLLKQLESFDSENLSVDDKDLIEKARKRIHEAFNEWQASQKTATTETPAESPEIATEQIPQASPEASFELSPRQIEKFKNILTLEPGQLLLYQAHEIFPDVPNLKDNENREERSAEILEQLRIYENKSTRHQDKTLIGKVRKKIEDAYENAGKNIIHLAANPRTRLETLIEDSYNTILGEPRSEQEAMARRRRDKLLQQLQDLDNENLDPEDRNLIEKARKRIHEAFNEWQTAQKAPMPENPSSTPEATPQESEVAAAVVMAEEIPEAPSIESTTKPYRERQKTTPAITSRTSAPQQPQGLFAEMSEVHSGRKPLKPIVQRPANVIQEESQQANPLKTDKQSPDLMQSMRERLAKRRLSLRGKTNIPPREEIQSNIPPREIQSI